MIHQWLIHAESRRSVRFWKSTIALGAIFFMGGCGGSSKPVSVTVKASAATVDGTDTATLTATVVNDKNSAGVTWSVSGGGALSNQTKTTATYTAPAASSSALTVTVTATSVATTTESAKATITVPAAPTLSTTNANLAGQVGSAYSVQLQGSGGIPPYVNWALSTSGAASPNPDPVNGVLPPCVTLSSAGLLSSATPPPASCAGTYPNLVFTFSDSGTPTPLTATTAPMTITIAAAPTITFPAPSAAVPGPATFGKAYSGSVAASGGSGTLSYTLTGALPGGLSLGKSTGAITGTPTAVGTFPFTVSASDAFGDSATSSAYSIVVSYAPVAITPASGSLPGGTAGTAYSDQTLTASGGSGTGYVWTVTGLPADGLDYAASGDTITISGTPTDAETVSFSVSVTDSALNGGGPNNYSIVVANASSGGSVLQGTYACLIRGFVDSSGDRFATLVSFQADGQGNLSKGAFDSNSAAYAPASGTLTGTYSVGTDGNGTATIATTSTSGTSTIAWALSVASSTTPAEQFSLVESDDAGAEPTGQHGMGNCYLSPPAAFAASTLSGNNFVFGADGEGTGNVDKSSVGRISFAASGLTVTGGAIDTAKAGNSTLSSATITGGSFTAPDSTTGRFTMTLEGLKSGNSVTWDFAGYVQGANHLLILRTDPIGPGDLGSGEAYKQQESSYSGANLKGGLIFYTQALEFDTTGSTGPTGYYSIIYAGSGDGTGNLTIAQSYMSENGTYTAGGTTGTVAVTFDSTIPGHATIGVQSGTIDLYFFDTDSAFEMSLGGGENPVESGRMEPQTQSAFTDAALAGTYMMTEIAPLEVNALDQNGELTVGSDGSLQGQFTSGGEGTYNFDQSFSATYAWDTTATGTGTFLAASPASWSCAVISSTRFVCVDQTAQPPAMRIFQQ